MEFADRTFPRRNQRGTNFASSCVSVRGSCGCDPAISVMAGGRGCTVPALPGPLVGADISGTHCQAGQDIFSAAFGRAISKGFAGATAGGCRGREKDMNKPERPASG